jgi:hypothetical protein
MKMEVNTDSCRQASEAISLYFSPALFLENRHLSRGGASLKGDLWERHVLSVPTTIEEMDEIPDEKRQVI